jgi:ribokinase
MHIVIVGSLNMDLVVRLPVIPPPGETHLGGTFRSVSGGKGANQAVAAARLGAQVTMIGCTGADTFGASMREGLLREGIDITHVREAADEASGVALIEVDAQGRNSIAVAPGANFALTAEDVEAAMAAIGAFDALVMPLETPIETIEAGARIASERGSLVILNPAPARELSDELLRMVDVLVPNEFELGSITGMPCQSEAELRVAGAALQQRGPGSVIVTMGARGALVLGGKTNLSELVPTFAVDAVDSTAAGDCFVGALAVGMCKSMGLRDAAEYAVAAAAISVTRFGAQPSLPTSSEVGQFLLERKSSR